MTATTATSGRRSVLRSSPLSERDTGSAQDPGCAAAGVTDSHDCPGRETEKGGLSTDIALSWLLMSLNCFLKRYIYTHTHIYVYVRIENMYTHTYVYVCT